MKIILLTTMTGFKQLIPVKDKAVEGKVKLFHLKKVGDKGPDKVKFPVGDKA